MKMLRHVVRVLFLLVITAGPAAAQTVITSASNVRLRSAPDTSSDIVAMLTLGSELQVTDSVRGSDWIRVRTGGAQDGWIDRSFAVAISPATYFPVATRLIETRLQRTGDAFATRVELLNFIDVLLRRRFGNEQRARLELQRLHALTSVLGAVPFDRTSWEPRVTRWIDEHKDEIQYSEPAGSWLLNRDIILATHAEYADTDVADEIAWFMVLNGVPGECEGFIVCYLSRANLLEGEYLRREPAGRHVREAVERLEPVIEYYKTMSKPEEFFDAQTECDELHQLVSALGGALRGSRAPDGAALAARLREMLQLCPAGKKTD